MANLTPALQKILAHQDFSKAEAKAVMQNIFVAKNSEQAAALLALLHYRGEKAHEIVGVLESLQKHALSIQTPYDALDIAGTGGDMAGTVNISTGSAILAAACGIPIVKHGNRAVSSQCGSADVLQALGVNIEMPPKTVQASLQKTNFAFLYAPLYYPLLKKVSSFRKKIGFPTLFNLIGPLLNPAKAAYLLIGVAKEKDLPLMREIIQQLPHVKKAFIYHGNGLDELSTFGSTTGYLIAKGNITQLEIDPQAFGFKPCALKDLRGGDRETNAQLLLDSLSGKMNAITDAFILNAGVALTIFGKSNSFAEGFAFAKQILCSGKARACLDTLVKLTQQNAKAERI